MKQADSFFVLSLKIAGACILWFTLGCGLFYLAIASDNHTFPYMTGDVLAQWLAICVYVGGMSILALLFLLLKAFLKRRNFDIESIDDSTRLPESWPTWLLKTAIGYVAAIIILLGSTLLLIPVFQIRWEDYWSDFQSCWIALPVALLAGLIASVISEAIKRVRRKRRLMKTRANLRRLVE